MTDRRWGGALEPDTGDSRSAMTRASDARPPRFYVASERAARQEPPEVTAARERWRAHQAALDALAAGEAMPDAAPGYEWYRELADDDGAP